MTDADLSRALLSNYQRDFPLTPRPFARIAEDLNAGEALVIEHFAALIGDGRIGRIGAVIRPHVLGASTLAAVAAPPEAIERIATLIAARSEINHCYEREHTFNIWFVVTAADQPSVARVLSAIERDTGLSVLELPLLESYHIDLGFPL